MKIEAGCAAPGEECEPFARGATRKAAIWLSASMLVLTVLLSQPAVASPVMTAQAGPGNRSSCGGTQQTNFGSDTVFAFHECEGFYGAASASAFADVGAVGASARILGFSNTSVPTEDTASASFHDTAIFSSSDPNAPLQQFPVSMNINFSGALMAEVDLATGGHADAVVTITVTLTTFHQLTAAYRSDFGFSVQEIVGFTGSGSPTADPTGIRFNSTLVTSEELMPSFSQAFTISINVSAGGTGFFSQAASQFGNTLKFPTGIDVFNLPPGYTVNAGNYLVNNRFIDPNVATETPEPATLAILGTGLLGLALRRRVKR